MNYNGGTPLDVAVAEGSECNVSFIVPITADAVTSEKVIVRLVLELSSGVKRKLGDDPVKLRATLDEVNAQSVEYTVEMPTTTLAPNAGDPTQYKVELDIETEEALKKDDKLTLKISGTFDADITSIAVMMFDEGGETMLEWTPKEISVKKDSEVTDLLISVTMTNTFADKKAKFTLFALYDAAPEFTEINFLKAGEEVHEGIELGPKSYETVS